MRGKEERREGEVERREGGGEVRRTLLALTGILIPGTSSLPCPWPSRLDEAILPSCGPDGGGGEWGGGGAQKSHRKPLKTANRKSKAC